MKGYVGRQRIAFSRHLWKRKNMRSFKDFKCILVCPIWNQSKYCAKGVILRQRRSVTNPTGLCEIPIAPCANKVYYRFFWCHHSKNTELVVTSWRPAFELGFISEELFGCLSSLCFRGCLSNWVGSFQLCEGDLLRNPAEFYRHYEWKTCCIGACCGLDESF